MTEPNNIRRLPLYRCATQLADGEPLVIRTLRVSDDDKMRFLLRRLVGVERISDLSWCEVHKVLPDKPEEVIVVIQDTRPEPRTERREYGQPFGVLGDLVGEKLSSLPVQAFKGQPAPIAETLPALPPPRADTSTTEIEVDYDEVLPFYPYKLQVA